MSSRSVVTLFLIVPLILCGPSAFAVAGFIVAPSYAVGMSPNAGAVGDFNGDGKPDIVTVNGVSTDITTILGNGNGRFGTAIRSVPGLAGGSAIGVGDFNRDGHLDVVLPGTFKGLAVFLGTGTGKFSAGFTTNLPGSADAVSVQDLNGDGVLDLITANGSAGTISVLLGKGDGTFQSPVGYAAGTSPNGIAVADFNSDGKLDVAVANFSATNGSFMLLLGNGDGTFGTATLVNGNGYSKLAAADVNSDGFADLIAVDNNSVASVFLGKGNGTFQPPQSFATGYPSTSVALADVNGDGRIDVVAGRESGVSVLFGNGDGTFQAAIEYAAGSFAEGVLLADFNNDAKLDVAVPNNFINSVSVLLNSGSGNFVAARQFEVNDAQPYQNPAASAIAANLNSDGNKDIALLTIQSQPGVHVLLGNGDGTFQADQYAWAGTFPGALAAGDFNKDHNIDLAVADSPGLVILKGNGDGTFQTAATYSIYSPAGMTVTDINGDGKLDIVAAISYLGRPFNALEVILGNGDGTFQPPVMYPGGPEGNSVAVGDINHDGKMDAIVGCYDLNGTLKQDIFIFLGNGDGTFQPAVGLTVQGSTQGIVLADFNKDGNLDLATGGYAQTSVLLGNGDGTFQAEQDIGLGGGGIKAIDVNGDGKLDLAVVDFQGNTQAFAGNGDGTFKPGKVFTAAGLALADAADFNHDGAPDFLQIPFMGQNATVLLNAR